jgi:long-chain fatty acid transport protein
MQKPSKLRLIPAAILALWGGSAAASGFQLLEQNASGIGNSYAGSAAVAENASTVFYNPAGMTQLQAREFSAGLTAVQTSYKFTNGGSSTGALSGNGGDGGGLGVIPNGYLSWALNKDLYVGIGFGAPFGLKTEYDNPWTGGAQSLKFDIKTYNINPSVAFRVSDKVSLGFGLNWQRMEAEYVRVVGINPAPIANVTPFPLNTSTAKLDADDDSWGWNAGALFTLSPATKVGVSYRSAIKHDLSGNLTVAGPYAPLNAASSSSAKAEIKLPDTLIVSVSQALDDRWEMLGDLSWTGWSSIEKVDVIRGSGALAQRLDTNFRDTWRVAFGANYKYSDSIKLKYGIAYDQTPIRDPEHRLVSLPDNNRVWLSVGAQWKPSKAAALDVGLAYLYVKDADIANNQANSLRGLVKGSFEDSAWIFGAQYSMHF